MLKDLVTPENANVFVGKLGDILERAIDKPLGYAINWGRIWSLWPVHIETFLVAVLNLAQHQVLDMMLKDLVSLKHLDHLDNVI